MAKYGENSGGYFNEMEHNETSVIWEIFRMFSEVCDTRCKYQEQLDEIARKETSAEEAGDDNLAGKYDEEWYAYFAKYCDTCPLHIIAIGRHKEDK